MTPGRRERRGEAEEEWIIYTPLPAQTCAYVCEKNEETPPVLSGNDREGSFTDLFYR